MPAGDIILYSDVLALINATLQKPKVKLVQQTAQSLTHNTDTPLTFGTGSEVIDSRGWHNESSNTTRVTPDIPGWYLCIGLVFVEGANTVTNIGACVRLNGTVQSPRQRMPIPATTFTKSVQITNSVPCNGTTDYLELAGYQFDTTAGTPLNRNTTVGGSFASVFEVIYDRAL